MSLLPQPIKLDDSDAKRLRDLNDKMEATRGFVTAVSQQAERRIAELTQEGRDIWQDLAKKHNLDLARVNYNLNTNGDGLVPVSLSLTA